MCVACVKLGVLGLDAFCCYRPFWIDSFCSRCVELRVPASCNPTAAWLAGCLGCACCHCLQPLTSQRAAVHPPWQHFSPRPSCLLCCCYAVAPLPASKLLMLYCGCVLSNLAWPACVTAAAMLQQFKKGTLPCCVWGAALVQQAFSHAFLHGKYSYMQQQLLYMRQGCMVCRAVCSVRIRHCLYACRLCRRLWFAVWQLVCGFAQCPVFFGTSSVDKPATAVAACRGWVCMGKVGCGLWSHFNHACVCCTSLLVLFFSAHEGSSTAHALSSFDAMLYLLIPDCTVVVAMTACALASCMPLLAVPCDLGINRQLLQAWPFPAAFPGSGVRVVGLGNSSCRRSQMASGLKGSRFEFLAGAWCAVRAADTAATA